MKYKVGDTVRVRKDLEADRNYGGIIFNTSMRRFKGKIVNIVGVNGCYYDIEEDYHKYAWNDEMLEPSEDNMIEYKGKKYDVKTSRKDFNKDVIFICKEHKEEILDEVEKEYLRNVIKYVIEPTHNEVKYIRKICNFCKNYYIDIGIDNMQSVYLPPFKDKRMYKGMELDKEYTVKDLGLDNRY